MCMVSVIMPCWNDGQYLRESIDSLRAQRFSDIELILVDDGSTEQYTLDRLCLVETIPKHQLLHTDHIGPSGARNYGIAHAKGKYILPLDADDTISPDYIARAVSLMEEQPELGIVYCRADLFGEQHGRWDLPDYSLRQMLIDNIIFVSALYRKSDWEEVGGYCMDFQHGMEDYDFWLSLIEKGRAVHQIPEVLFHYRIKPQSRTARFMNNGQHVQETYRMLYQRHKPLYYQHYDLYAMALRESLIDAVLVSKRVQGEYGMVKKVVDKIPTWLKKRIKKMIR